MNGLALDPIDRDPCMLHTSVKAPIDQRGTRFGPIFDRRQKCLGSLAWSALLCYASPPRNRSIAPMGSVRARVTWLCYVIANGNSGPHYPGRPACPAWATLSGRNPSR